MANVKFSRKEVEKHITLDEKTLDRIMMSGIPVESLDDNDLELRILPNRPDLLSMQGFLRHIKAFLGKESGLKKYKVNKSGFKLIVDKSLPEEWPYAVACIVKGLSFNDEKIKEAIQIQEKLGATLLRNRKKGGIGIYPLEKINFPITFKGIEPDKIRFRPLEYPDEITGRQILQKHPTGREYAHICQKWSRFPVFIDSSNKIMSMPPIINSHDLGKIDSKTKDLFIEATGTDLKSLKSALAIIATTSADLGGKIYSIECIQQDKTKENIPDPSSETIKINLENTNKLLGLNLKEKDLEKLLPRMGYDYSKGEVKVPNWRTDILHEVDIIGDVAIAYGYENLIPVIPEVATIAEESKESKIKSKVSEILVGLGLQGISSYHLIKTQEIKESQKEDFVELLDSKTDYKYLRNSLMTPSLRILSENKDNEYPQKIFEIGNVFVKKGNSISEQIHLSIALAPDNFTGIKQVLEFLGKSINLDLTLKEFSKEGLIEGRAGRVIVNNKEVGYIGEIHPETLKQWTIKMPVSFLELNITELFDL